MSEDEFMKVTGKDLAKPHTLKGFETGHMHSPQKITEVRYCCSLRAHSPWRPTYVPCVPIHPAHQHHYHLNNR
jgi:hypothetical protein